MRRFKSAQIFAGVLLVSALVIAPGISAGANPSYSDPEASSVLRIATGSPYELGLMDALIEPFEEKYGCRVEVTRAGSGASLNLGRKGDVDLVLVHAPEEERKFVADGYGLNRTYIMHNDFVIVGPKDDPAGIRGMTDAAKAYTRIALTESLFFSRGDNSGTHQKEMSIWEEANITPTGDWYKVTNDFMGATLKSASNNQGYFMTDRSTYIKVKGNTDLEILCEGNPGLVNRYSAIAVNPKKHPGVNYDLAKTFIRYIISPEGQAIIRDFGKGEYGEPLYYPAISEGVTFTGLFEREVVLSVDYLRELGKREAPVMMVGYHKGYIGPFTYTGVPLKKAMLAAGYTGTRGVQTSPEDIIIVTGEDGYSVALSWGEVMNQISGMDIILAYEKDGKSLPSYEGPVRLIVPGDYYCNRYVKGVVKVEAVALHPNLH